MSNEDLTAVYVEVLMAAHNQLYSYIFSLTGKPDQAEDILQDTNKKLWQLKDEYDHSQEFLPWAYTVAYNQVRAARSKTKRERLVFQDEEVLHALANEQISRAQESSDRGIALEKCISTLSDKHKKLINKYYTEGFTMEEVGQAFQRSAGSIAVALHRIRITLLECIKGKLA